MITREEAKQKLCMNLLCSEASGISWVSDDFVIELINKLFDQQDQLQQHIKSLEAQLANTEQLTCEYKEDNDIYYMGTVYNFNCGYSYVTIEGDLKENGVNYCPSCGGKITTKDTQ